VVNYSRGDEWDERQRREDERRFYGPGGGGHYSGGGGYSRGYGGRRGGGGKKAAIIGVVIVAAIAGLYFVNPFNLQLPSLALPDDDDGTTPIQPDDEAPSQDSEIQQVAEDEAAPTTSKTMVTNTLLHKDINFVSKGVEELEVVIPELNDGYLYSIITPDVNSFVDVRIFINSDEYCIEDTCEFIINGIKGSEPDTYEQMEIPVDAGDNVSFLIGSNPTGFSQVVQVSLRTLYEKEVVQSQEQVAEVPVAPQETQVVGQPTSDIDYIERRVHALVNEYRVENGRSALSYDTELVSIARGHSLDMAENDFFDHDNLRGMDPTDRAEAAGYSCYKIYGSYYTEGLAENIWQGWLYDSITYIGVVPYYNWLTQDEIAELAVDGWISSPGHRANLLEENYDREGIGVAIAADDKVYITQDFC